MKHVGQIIEVLRHSHQRLHLSFVAEPFVTSLGILLSHLIAQHTNLDMFVFFVRLIFYQVEDQQSRICSYTGIYTSVCFVTQMSTLHRP